MKYAVKAYGHTHVFKSEAALRHYLAKWILSTEGSERDRAIRAYVNLACGITFTDTDKD